MNLVDDAIALEEKIKQLAARLAAETATTPLATR